MGTDKSELFVIAAFNSVGYWTCAVELSAFEKVLGIPDVGILGGIEQVSLLGMRSEVLYEAIRRGFNSGPGRSGKCYVDPGKRGLLWTGAPKGMKVLLCAGEGRVEKRKDLDGFKDWMVDELRLIFGFVSEPFFAGPSQGMMDESLKKSVRENEAKMLAELERWKIGQAARQGVAAGGLAAKL